MSNSKPCFTIFDAAGVLAAVAFAIGAAILGWTHRGLAGAFLCLVSGVVISIFVGILVRTLLVMSFAWLLLREKSNTDHSRHLPPCECDGGDSGSKGSREVGRANTSVPDDDSQMR